jgi:hypothetical protein
MNPQERSFFAFLFNAIDGQCGNTGFHLQVYHKIIGFFVGKVAGAPLQNLMKRSGLSSPVLSQVHRCTSGMQNITMIL